MEERYAVRGEQTATQMIGGEALIINFDTYYYYSLNRTGTAIWNLLRAGGRDRAELSSALAAAFDRPASTLSGDVDVLIDTLLADGLIERAHTAAGQPAVVDLGGDYAAPSLEKHEKLDQVMLSGE